VTHHYLKKRRQAWQFVRFRFQHGIDFVEFIISCGREGIEQRAVGREHFMELSLELEQAAFAGQELATVERYDRAEFGLGLFASCARVDLADSQCNRFADVGFFAIVCALKGSRALESLSIRPFREANLTMKSPSPCAPS
jgi:hypothetical protein